MVRYISILIAFSMVPAAARGVSSDLLEIRGQTMGTVYSVKVVGRFDTNRRRHIERAVAKELARVTNLMSTYDPESELSRFNRFRSTEPFPVSRPTIEVFRVAREVSELTSGGFDVTIGPLISAWGFGATDRVPAAPEAAELERRRRHVGFRLLSLDDPPGTVRKEVPDVVCDLSAIAKGDAVDRVAQVLRSLGYDDSLVEVGGDLRASGRREDGRAWRVAIERPVPERGTIQRTLELSDLAMATSGDYRNYYESGGVRVSHVIDPRSARPIAHGLASVTVLHRSAAHADALATGLLVLGPVEGPRLAETRDLAVYFIIRREDGTFRTMVSTAFQSYLTPPAGDGC
jgi:thiamine biosynthesis lipoprotein